MKNTNDISTPPLPPIPPPVYVKKSGGEFVKGLKWSLGINAGCCGVFMIFFFLIFTLFAILGALAVGIGSSDLNKTKESSIEGIGPDKIAIINISGEILSGSQSSVFDSANADSKTIISQLKKAKEDPFVRAVVLRIKTPGGSVTASDEIHNKVKELAKEKKVVASFDGLAASGGYYIACGSDKIFANPATLTGSIGVIITIPNLSSLYDKIGYKEVVIKSGKLKDIGSSTRELTSEEKDIFQGLIDDFYERFVEVVSDGRKMSKDEVKKIADGRIYSGKQAKALKLIDNFGGLDEAISEAKILANIQNAQVIEYRHSFWEDLSGVSSRIAEKIKLFSFPTKSSPSLEYKWIE